MTRAHQSPFLPPLPPYKPFQNGLVDSPSEEDIQQEPLYNDQAHDSPCKAEPVQVVVYEGCSGADLDGVGVIS